jgi:hypothetical protein
VSPLMVAPITLLSDRPTLPNTENKTMGEYVVFAIDNDNDLHTNARFLRYVDELRAMSKMDGTMQLCIGSYLGQMERSYIVTFSDFIEHIMDSGYVDKQESVMVLRDGYYGKVYATLKFNNYGYDMEDGRGDMLLGILKAVDKDDALAEYGWTYRPDLNQYYVVEAINEHEDVA